MKTQAQYEAEGLPDTHGLAVFTNAYIVAALWSSVDDAGNPLDDRFNDDNLAPELLASIVNDCRNFYNRYWKLLHENPAQGGHDFWLTRNGHGAGFWDRPEVWGEEGAKALTDACGWRTDYPEVDLYVNETEEVIYA